MSAYRTLETRFGRLGTLREALAVLNWDFSSMMPTGGAAARQAQLATLETLYHEQLTDPAIPDLIGEAEAAGGLDEWQSANLAEMRREWRAASVLPAALVEARVAAGLDCEMAWRRARPDDDFAAVVPALQRVLDLTREAAAAKASLLGISSYDALLDTYEPGGRAAAIDVLFEEVARFLPGLIDRILERQAAVPPPVDPPGPFPIAAQRAVAMRLMAQIGFDFDHGRLDTSLHPFCGGTPDDVRITTRYEEEDFGRALMGVLHETGHALYEQGLPAAWRRQPVGRARSFAVHESQSLLIEMQACRSREFAEFAAPILQEAFGGPAAAWDPDNLYRRNTIVARSLIRVDADEATYPLHVILRYRLERAMLSGDLRLSDLPGAWREAMRDLVGIEPTDDRDGCLQDIHWYCGLWGYFPSYTLGALTAAQFFEAATRQDAGIRPGLTRGDFAPLLAWLRRHVHGRAASVPVAEIVVDATGRALDTSAFQRHLERRYGGLH
ncbi:MAG TPA: carboxypeptidase M32 [Stellaceae bacterium]|nr:carboxypeptidase M32 [Stellaceae bacterium]